MSRNVLPDVPVSYREDRLIKHARSFAGRLERLADDMATATLSTDGPPGACYAIYGPWGRGKSSAARYLQGLLEDRLATDTAAGADATHLVTIQPLHMPNLLNDPRHIRAQVGYALLDGLSAASIGRVYAAVADATGQRSLPSTVVEADRQRESRRELFELMLDPDRGPFALEAVLSHLRADTGRPAQVLILDEIDRCSFDQTFELLRSIDYWLRAPRIFFVLVSDEQHLLRTVEDQARNLDRSANIALEKYVHQSVVVPDFLARAGGVRRFVDDLLRLGSATTEEREAILDQITDEGLEDSRISVLDPLLLWAVGDDRTPRSVKQMLNALVAEVREVGINPVDLKARVISIKWPDFYRRHIVPVLELASAQAHADVSVSREYRRAEWLTQLERIGRLAFELAPHWGREFAAGSVRELGPRQRVDVGDVPPDLVLYLGSPPSVVPPTLAVGAPDPSGGGPGTADFSSLAEQVHESKTDADPDAPLQLQQQLLQARLARRKQSPLAARDILRQLEAAIERVPLDRSQAYIAGEAALEAELNGDVDLAWRLYGRAVDLDPDSTSVLVNGADFLAKLTQPTREQLEVGREWADRGRDRLDEDPDRRLQRAQMLAGFYRRVRDDDAAAELEQVVLSEGLAHPDLESFKVVMRTLQTQDEPAVIESYTKDVLQHAVTVADAHLVLRAYADAVLRRPEPEWENVAMAAYVDLIRSGAACASEGDLAPILGNLAIGLIGRDVESLAEALWVAGIRRAPENANMRAAFARFLSAQGEDERAEQVLGTARVGSERPIDWGSLERGIGYSTIDRWWGSRLEDICAGRSPCL